MRDRYAPLKYLQTLDPKSNHEEIHRISSGREFPWDYGRGLEVAIWRTCCVPSISEVLDGSGEFALRAQKRYDDTRILLGEMVRSGYDSDRGRQALRQINHAHRRFTITNDDMLYVLSTFVFEPIRWIDRWAWRKTSETEQLAAFYFYAAVGKRMNIRDLPTDCDAFERFNRDYEHEFFRPTPSNHRVGTSIINLYASWYWRPVSSLVAATLPCRLDAAALDALELPTPPRWARTLNRIGLRSHAQAERVAPALMARVMTRPTARTYPGYPAGYRISDIGPHQPTAPDQRHPAPHQQPQGLSTVMEHITLPVPTGRTPDIGDTPLRPIRIPVGDRTVRIWLKLEAENPFGSIKARTADALLARLEATGELRPGRRVVESTSGNLGVALAGLCAARGYRCTLVVEPSTPRSSVDQMTAYGAEVVTVSEVPGGRTLSARLEAVRAILASDGDAIWTNQYESPANPGIHEWQTASELVRAAPGGRFDAIAVAVSTGGTLAGIARYFRDHLPETRIIAVDAVGSAALGGNPADRPFKLAGFGSGRVSGFVERHHWDHIVRLRDSDAATASARIRARTGVSLGGSGGAAVLAAVVRAAVDPGLREIACVCPDSGEKYPQLNDVLVTGAAGTSEEITGALDLLDRAYPAEKASA